MADKRGRRDGESGGELGNQSLRIVCCSPSRDMAVPPGMDADCLTWYIHLAALYYPSRRWSAAWEIH